MKKRKFHAKESYEDIIWDLIEDTEELSEETQRDIEKSRAEIKAGKYHTLEEVRKRLGL